MKRRPSRPIRLRKPKPHHVAIVAITAPFAAIAAVYAGEYVQLYTPVILDALTPWG